MADTHTPLPGSTYETTLAALSSCSVLPDMIVLDADHVLWPCACQRLSEDVMPYPDGPAVLSALHARGIRLAVVACPSQTSDIGQTDQQQQSVVRQGVQAGLETAQEQQPTSNSKQAAQTLRTSVGAALNRLGVSSLIDVVHVLEPPAAPDPSDANGATGFLTAIQAQVEAHWRSLRTTTGVPWSACLALVGSAGHMRAVNRVGAACVLVKTGPSASIISTGLELWAAKAQGDRGY